MLVIALFYIYSNCLMAIIPQYARNIKPFWILLQQEMMQVAIRNGDRVTEPKPSKNEPSQNSGFAKNRTQK